MSEVPLYRGHSRISAHNGRRVVLCSQVEPYRRNLGRCVSLFASNPSKWTSSDHDFIRTSVPEKNDFLTRITTHVQLPVTSQCNCVVISLANRNEDP